jgi:hypothetical protein
MAPLIHAGDPFAPTTALTTSSRPIAIENGVVLRFITFLLLFFVDESSFGAT